jgi:hypothetical protein
MEPWEQEVLSRRALGLTHRARLVAPCNERSGPSMTHHDERLVAPCNERLGPSMAHRARSVSRACMVRRSACSD